MLGLEIARKVPSTDDGAPHPNKSLPSRSLIGWLAARSLKIRPEFRNFQLERVDTNLLVARSTALSASGRKGVVCL